MKITDVKNKKQNIVTGLTFNVRQLRKCSACFTYNVRACFYYQYDNLTTLKSYSVLQFSPLFCLQCIPTLQLVLFTMYDTYDNVLTCYTYSVLLYTPICFSMQKYSSLFYHSVLLYFPYNTRQCNLFIVTCNNVWYFPDLFLLSKCNVLARFTSSVQQRSSLIYLQCTTMFQLVSTAAALGRALTPARHCRTDPSSSFSGVKSRTLVVTDPSALVSTLSTRLSSWVAPLEQKQG